MPTILQTPKPATVIKNYRTKYHTPIAFSPGELLRVGRFDDQYPGWVWTTTPDGNSGWAPANALEISGATARALQAYDAREMDVDAGEALTLKQEESGWYWAENSDGAGGWVPAENLRLLE
ncbi:MAG: hypothetical protein HPY76_12680 [Anaerolineae bacterium]|jgi:hypothetical protein|nr:hypothetical protein [Anaerolineae bacterium]